MREKLWKRKEYVVEVACACDIGRCRENNEDNFYINGKNMPLKNYGLHNVITETVYLKNGLCYAVFDGMGGESNGEDASYLAGEELRKNLSILDEKIISEKQFLYECCQSMDRLISNHKTNGIHLRMGCTAVIFFYSNEKIYMCNVGDSRAYRFRSGKLQQLSIDHNNKKMLDELKVVHRKPYLTQYLGMASEGVRIEPYIAKGKIWNKDRYLLCSDGLTDMLSDEQIEKVIRTNTNLTTCTQELMRKALEAGGKDNVTIIMNEIHQR